MKGFLTTVVLDRRYLRPRRPRPMGATRCWPSPGIGGAEGSSTICAKITALAAANGRRAHQRRSVLGCLCRIDFYRAEALLSA